MESLNIYSQWQLHKLHLPVRAMWSGRKLQSERVHGPWEVTDVSEVKNDISWNFMITV